MEERGFGDDEVKMGFSKDIFSSMFYEPDQISPRQGHQPHQHIAE